MFMINIYTPAFAVSAAELTSRCFSFLVRWKKRGSVSRSPFRAISRTGSDSDNWNWGTDLTLPRREHINLTSTLRMMALVRGDREWSRRRGVEKGQWESPYLDILWEDVAIIGEWVASSVAQNAPEFHLSSCQGLHEDWLQALYQLEWFISHFIFKLV